MFDSRRYGWPTAAMRLSIHSLTNCLIIFGFPTA